MAGSKLTEYTLDEVAKVNCYLNSSRCSTANQLQPGLQHKVEGDLVSQELKYEIDRNLFDPVDSH